MSANDIDRTLAEWFAADAPVPAPADGLDRVLQGVRRHRPRPVWLAGPGSHWGWADPDAGSRYGVRVLPPLGLSWSGAVVLVLVLGALLGGAILVGARLLEASPLPRSQVGELVYAVDGDIFLADADGGNAVRVADGLPGGKSGCGVAGFKAEGPMWSPDGGHFAYRSGRRQVDCERPDSDTFPRVLISDPAGNVVAEVPGVGWLVPWSPDSTRIATWLGLYPMTTIAIYGLDGVRQAQLTIPPGEVPGDYEPIWSPVGASLLVPISKPTATDPQGLDLPEIWEVPVDGSPPRRVLAGDPRANRLSRASPDGTQVASVVGQGLTVARVDGSQARELIAEGVARGYITYPVWSPGGDRIAFVTGTDETTSDLRIVDVASGSVTPLYEAGTDEGLSVIAFSPEGDRLLLRVNDDRQSSLWSVAVDGSDPKLIVTGAWAGDWRPLPADGSRPGG